MFSRNFHQMFVKSFHSARWFQMFVMFPLLGMMTTTTTMTQHDIYYITTMVAFFSAGLKPPTMAEAARTRNSNSPPKCGGCDQRPGHLPMVLTCTGSVWGNSGGCVRRWTTNGNIKKNKKKWSLPWCNWSWPTNLQIGLMSSWCNCDILMGYRDILHSIELF